MRDGARGPRGEQPDSEGDPTSALSDPNGELRQTEDQPTQEESVSSQAAKGVMWMTAQTWFARAGGLVTVAILTRLLAPEDFGLLAIATTLLTLTYVLSDLGLSTYVVQAAQMDRRSLSTAFWVSLMGGVIIGLAIFLAAPGIALLLRIPQSVPIIRAMTVIVLLIAATSVPLALLRRRMAFRLLAVQASIGAILAQIVAIAAAFAGLGVWALVLQLLVGQVVASVAMWINARWRPTMEFSRSAFKTMSSFGVHVVGSGLVYLARVWAETGIIAAGLGVRELGYFNIAQRLVQTAMELSGAALHPVSTVAFAKVSSSVERLRAAHTRAAAASQTVVTPLMIFIAVSASILVPFLFGSNWTVSAEIAQPLAIAAALSFGTALDHGLFDGAGHPGWWLIFSTIILGCSVAVTSLSVRHGVLMVAFAFVATATIEMVGRWLLVSRLLGTNVVSTARPFLMVVPAALASAAAGLGSMWILRTSPTIVALTVVGMIVLVVHLFLVRTITPIVWADLLSLVPLRRLRLPRRLSMRPRRPR